jgi:DNA-binding PadR family transcriptional regulator
VRTRTTPQDAERCLPLKPVDFLILLALAGGERHGYRLMLEIAEQTGQTVVLEAGNLYRALRRLLTEGWVAESERRPAPEADDERRRYYALTPFGRRVVSAEARRLRALVRAAEARRLIAPEPAR